jgi:hypothetical protein
MPIFALSVFVSAFLLFAVQPMVAKFLLPFFGGSAAVWSTCLVFFQILLLGGYTYAHLLRTRLSPMAQRWTNLGLLVLSLAFLPRVPSVHLTGVQPARRSGRCCAPWPLPSELLFSRSRRLRRWNGFDKRTGKPDEAFRKCACLVQSRRTWQGSQPGSSVWLSFANATLP